MNKSPETVRRRHSDTPISPEAMARVLAFEARIQSDEHPIADRELAADREFRRQLASIQPPTLRPTLRRQVMAHAAHRRLPMSWMALAAAVVMSLLVVLALQSVDEPATIEAHQLTANDWAQLHLALETLDASGRRVAQATEREVRPHLKRPEIQITSMPDSETVWSWFRSSLQSTR